MAGTATATEAESTERVRNALYFIIAAVASIRRSLIKQRESLYFSTPIRLSATYSATKYSSPAAKTESNLNSIVENLMANQARRCLDVGDTTMSNVPGVSIFKSGSDGGKHQAVARKSTTRSIASYARPSPRVFKAVARKSTNPLPRYPSNAFMLYRSMPCSTKTELEAGERTSGPFSHYGRPSSPINLAELKTFMVVGGRNMRLTCLTLSTLININPKVWLKDIRKNPRFAAILSDSD